MHDDAGTPAKDTRTWAKAWAEAFPTAAAPDWWPLHMKFSTQFKNFHVGFTTPNVSQLQAFLTVMLKWRVNKLLCSREWWRMHAWRRRRHTCTQSRGAGPQNSQLKRQLG